MVLAKADRNDKKTLALHFRELKAADAGPELDAFDKTQSAAVESSGGNTISMLLFPFKIPTDVVGKDPRTDKEKVELILEDMTKLKNQLTHVLQQFVVKDQIAWDPYKGTGVDKATYQTRLLDQDVLTKIYENYAEQFIAMITPFVDNDKYAVRLKLIRQSAEKHFATLPSRYIDTNPFMEPMDVPAAASKLAFTKWEKEKGYDSGTPVKRSEADAIPDAAATGSQSAEAVNVFGQRV